MNIIHDVAFLKTNVASLVSVLSTDSSPGTVDLDMTIVHHVIEVRIDGPLIFSFCFVCIN